MREGVVWKCVEGMRQSATDNVVRGIVVGEGEFSDNESRCGSGKER